MKVFLAGTRARLFYPEMFELPYVLESFAYFTERQKRQLKTAKMFMLDSGAFTFMSGNGGDVNFDKYLERYIAFINENDIRYFFELDIDSVVGYETVKDYRRLLERKTGRRCIPVWHKSRGLDEYKRMVKEYDYIAVGGIANGDIKRSEYKYFTPLLNYAHQAGCKVHGLGFTDTGRLHQYPFDSVDSTSWISGSRFGSVYRFNGRRMVATTVEGKRMIDYKIADLHNLREWMKFQKYADSYL